MTSSSESIALSHPFNKPTGATPSSVRPVKTASSTYFNKVERVPRSNNHIAATSTTRTLDPTAPVSPTGPPTRSLTNDKVDEDSFMSPVASALPSSQVSSRAFVPPSITSKASQPFSNSSRSSSGSLGTASFRHRDRLPPPEKRSMSSPTPLTTTDIALRALALSAAATVKRKPVDDYDTYKARQTKKTSREEWKTRKSSLASLENPPPRRSSSSDKALQSQRLAAFVLKRQDEEDVAERGHVTPRKKQWRQQRAAFQGNQSMFHATNPPQLQEMSSDGWRIPKKLAK
ncbi:hypothetical protein DYB38_011747 [Aphanomyces astaci]|uniref:Uncharacterized protein n=1 Tax=Aphanomyces astaci TaxID=112090 RepID=A0A397CMR9_APHAT|nr:hypothetical protein DYB38_011747 [Aphanomyces astaci]